ncbi:amino acid or sugar ABC transport system, permease protein [delta proteobacterium NaphS2]|nr:amino acid or sugar ABC transport system, permease protein [delta proteobacterium NaphS2]
MKETEKLKPFPPAFHSPGRLKTRYEEGFNRFRTARGRRFMVITVICLFGLLPLVLNDYMLHLFHAVCIYAIVAVGLTIMTGYTGQLSLAHGAFFGIGAYTAASLVTWASLPFFLVIPAAGTVATLFGALFAIPSLRLKPIFLPMATLAGQFIVEYILVHRLSFAGGSKGFVMPKPVLVDLGLETKLSLFYVTAICLLIIIWLSDNLLRSKTGRAFRALRQNERAAAAMGIDAYRHKLFAFAVSSFLAGLAGALFAYAVETIVPTFFNLTLSIEFLAIMIIGGLGSISGAIIGSVAIVFLKEIIGVAGAFSMNSNIHAGAGPAIISLYEFVLGLVIVLFIIFKPEGLASFYRKIKQGFNRWPFS